jgi:hypothetical protein
MKKLLPLLLLATAFSPAAFAANITALDTISQANFRLLSEDFGSALSYKAVSPAEPLGITGFDIGVEVSSTDISKSSAVLATATGSTNTVNNLVVPKLHLVKGLPFGIDIGAFIASVPTTNIKLVGGEFKVALLQGGVAYPAIALRGAMTSLSGVDQLAFSTKSLDLSISKGFLMFTPYAGVGQVWVTSTPQGTAAVWTAESFNQSKVFVGANLNFGLANFALEGDRTGGTSSYSAKFGFRW